jgi:hypothetical protein
LNKVLPVLAYTIEEKSEPSGVVIEFDGCLLSIPKRTMTRDLNKGIGKQCKHQNRTSHITTFRIENEKRSGSPTMWVM